jgi:transposase
VATQDLPRSAAHPFYARLNQILDQHVDGYVEGLCQRFYREFLGLVLPEVPPDHSTGSRTRRLIDLETHEAVFTV